MMPKVKEHVKHRLHPYERPYESKPTTSPPSKPLLVYFDLETTGLGDCRRIGIIEIGAKVHGHAEEKFSSLVRTDKRIDASASGVHGLYNKDLVNEEPFLTVFGEFIAWLKSTIQRCSEEDQVDYYAVLVAHNGFNYDYMVLISEIRSHGADPSFLSEVKFADSLHHLRKAKKQESSLVADSGLGLQALYVHFFQEENYTGHRALADAENIERLFTESRLKHLLPFTLCSYKSLRRSWKQKTATKDMQSLFRITPQQAKRLNELELTNKKIKELFKVSQSIETFDRSLHRLGVNSKPLREKMVNVLQSDI